MDILSKAGKILTTVLAAIAFAGAMPANAQTSILSGYISGWQYTWTPCSGTYCPGWAPLEGEPQGIAGIAVSDSGVIYNLTWSGQVWSSGPTTPAWTLMGSSSDIDRIDARGGVYQVHSSGEVDMWVPSRFGWLYEQIDKRPNISQIAAGAGATELYEILSNGQIWRYTGTGWQELDNNPLGMLIAAGNNVVYQMHNDGSIWQYTGTPCKNGACSGWEMLDNNSQTVHIVADSYNNLYQLQGNGEIWKYTGTPCKAGVCGGWQKLDDNPLATWITAGGGYLYQFHGNGQIWKYTGVPCSGNYCPGWQMLDDNSATIGIAAGGDYLYQFHGPNEIIY
jgi:hypothetical protein